MFEKLTNKVIIITGANGLIGRSTVKHLSEHGATVVAVDLTSEDTTLKNVEFIAKDVTNSSEINELIACVIEKYGKVDGLVNLAYPRTKDWGAKFENIELDSWRENVDMQLNSLFYICQKVLELMQNQNSGAIVNIASIYGVVGNDFSLYEEYGGTSPAAYSAIKGGTINFTKYLASYYGKYNIRVNCVSPGGILDEKNQHPSFIERYSAKSPLKRLGNPQEIAPAITFLLSDEASFITGHNLMVDGGWTII